METNKPMARAGYLLALLLIVTPLADGTLQLLPLKLADERWRFGAVGSLSNLLLVPLLGLLIAIGVATLTDARRTKRVIGTICAILGIGLAALSALFILDYFQVRVAVVPKLQHSVAVATSTALIKNLVSIIVLFLLSRAGFAGPRVVTPRKGMQVTEPVSSAPLLPLGGAAPTE